MIRISNRLWALVGMTVMAGAFASAGTREARVIDLGNGGPAVDLALLGDGETRVFGTGEKKLVAQRKGDVVTLTREADGGPSDMICRLATDRCLVVENEDSGRIAVKIERHITCSPGQADCAEELVRLADCPGGSCVGQEDRRVKVVVMGTEPGGHAVVVGAGGPHAVGFSGPGRTLLTCPEGDATLMVEVAEAGQRFNCPRHGVALEAGLQGTTLLWHEVEAQEVE